MRQLQEASAARDFLDVLPEFAEHGPNRDPEGTLVIE
jgi:hypothetical protein